MGTHSCCRSIHFIHPGHRLAQIARSRIQTVYFPERNYLMLPSSLSEKIFSLGIDARTRRNHVMTFSARMRYDASFLEYKVRPLRDVGFGKWLDNSERLQDT